MAHSSSSAIEDGKGLLSAEDHMRDMEHVEFEIVALERPFASVTRVTARIEAQDASAWLAPNLAVRIDVESNPEGRATNRIYTIRSFDAERMLIEIDFVMHEDDSPAMRWLAAMAPGSKARLIGPRPHLVPNPQAVKKAALFADETAIPAVYSMLQLWPEGSQAEIWIETADQAAFAELPRPAGVVLHHLPRAAAVSPGSGMQLLAAARNLAQPGDWSVWAAGERQEMREIRNHFRDAGLARDDLQVVGYWRRGVSSTEIDRVRLAEYERLRAQGQRLEDLPDTDLPI